MSDPLPVTDFPPEELPSSGQPLHVSDCSVPTRTSRLQNEWATFVTAVQFLTQIPLSTSRPTSTDALARCPIYFPLIGGLIGVATSVVLGVASLVWPVWLSVIVALAFEARLTGAFHEDAVADFCDAFGGGWTRDDVLRILKDSRIGTYGAIGLGLAVALRAGAMVEIVHEYGRENWLAWSAAFVAASVLGRFIIVVVMVFVPPVSSRESLSRHVGGQIKWTDLLFAGLLALPAIIPFATLLPLHFAISATLLILEVVWFRSLIQRVLGGITGDCLGFIGYLSTIVVLLVTAARWRT